LLASDFDMAVEGLDLDLHPAFDPDPDRFVDPVVGSDLALQPTFHLDL
jgi:hypothetical protein